MKRRLWLAGLILLLAVPLVLVVQEFVRDVLLVEVLRTLWIARILFESLPQLIVWGFLLLIVLLIAVKRLLLGMRFVQEAPGAEAASQGQVQHLTKRIRRASESAYSAWSLSRILGKLIVEVLAYRQAASSDLIKQRMRTRTLDVPAEIQSYLQGGLGSGFLDAIDLFSRLRQRLFASPEAFRRPSSLERIVQFLEEQLEG
jgi:hypothetical protein